MDVKVTIRNADSKAIVVHSSTAKISLDVRSGELSSAVLQAAGGSLCLRNERALRDLLEVLTVAAERLNFINSTEAVRV